MRKRRWIIPVSFIFFIISLFLVESTWFGSANVAAYNGGYGTFDMKSYDIDSVYSVLEGAKEGYLGAAIKYYVVDYLFIIAFLNFQMVIGISVCKGLKWRWPLGLLIGTSGIRAAADVVENTLLVLVIINYPSTHNWWVKLASYATHIKLVVIPVWFISCMIVLVSGIIIRNNRSKDQIGLK